MSNPNVVQAALQRGADCPELEVLFHQLNLAVGDPQRVTAEQHVEHCPHCTTEMRMLREFEGGEALPGEAADVAWITSRLEKDAAPEATEAPRQSWWRQWFTPKVMTGFAAAAAAAVLAIGISVESGRTKRGTEPVPEFREETLRALAIDVVEAPGAFAWKPVVGAEKYELTARTVDQTVIFHNFLTTQTLAYPPEVAAIVVSGKQLWWEVVARDASGNEIARSGIHQLKK